MNNSELLTTSLVNLQAAGRRLGLSSAMLERLSEPKEKIELALHPVCHDRRTTQVKAYIVRHNDALGPSKGGIRMSSTVTLNDIVGMAMEMTWKTALIGVPFGGGKSGVCFAPELALQNDKEVVMRSFTRSARRHFGPEIYIPAPDMGTNERDMGHIRDCISYSDGMSITRGCFVTGKPVVLGGIVGRREATGKGVVHTLAAACQKLGIELSQAKVAVQGFGNVGSVAAKQIFDLGARVIAVADVNGGVYAEEGLDIDSLRLHFDSTGKLQGLPGGQPMTNQELLACRCDILILAATQSQLNESNADRVQAGLIAEGANAPITPEADSILRDKGVFIIPDILCNAGGVFVSYLEYTQETQREQMTAEQVEVRLRNRMIDRFDRVYDYSQSQSCAMRDAAMDLAVGLVVEGIEMRGFLP